MKPLLILLPAPGRWNVVESALAPAQDARRADLAARFATQTEGASDAVAAVPHGSGAAAACVVRRRGDVGVLCDLHTRPERRKQGMARSILQTLLSWFDMTGGRWLYAFVPADGSEQVLENFGFKLLHRNATCVSMCRTLGSTPESPLPATRAVVHSRELTPADWPCMVALAQHDPGPDPRVPLAEAALASESAASELCQQHRAGKIALLGAFVDGRLVGYASLAIDALGKRTYAMRTPIRGPEADALAAAVSAMATGKGYELVDYPLEAIAAPA